MHSLRTQSRGLGIIRVQKDPVEILSLPRRVSPPSDVSLGGTYAASSYVQVLSLLYGDCRNGGRETESLVHGRGSIVSTFLHGDPRRSSNGSVAS